MPERDVKKAHPLATEGGIGFLVGYLVGSGAMCPKCGYATRATSKRWARCKRTGCGHRVLRKPRA